MGTAVRVRRSAAVIAAALALTLVAPAPAQADQVRDLEYWLTDYGFTTAWQTTRGAGVKVAVIDTGVDGSVPDLAGALGAGTDVSGVGAANGQKPLGDGDAANHGTWVASLLAGRGTGDGNGVLGAAPEATILPASVALGKAMGPIGSDEQIAQAIHWAVDNGATVINMSLTRNTLDWPTSWDDAFQYAFQHDVVIVAAAGNRGSGTTEVGAPATIPGVLTVAGVDRQGQASFDASSQGITIGVSAPSEQLVGANPGGGYVQWEGTSGAAPLVSGAVALVRAAHPELKAADVIERIIKTARPAGGSVPSPIYGFGLLDAAAAVTASVPHVTANPMGDLSEWIRVHRRAETTATPAPTSDPQAIPAPAKLTPERAVEWTRFFWPQWSVLTTFWIPFALITGFVALAALGGVGAWLHFRRRVRRG
ncbi:type VII secretion-associated serine protease mycosin [Leifsonia aquatica]|uniref:Type VII secretion-associated serine protease mycosin n=3 Tax=Leifsonia aquatica TaxID=144185 RepID=A0A7W4UVX3_LEIAQ|nr:S8 family serine peptidase [Leifsonia aquatica]MBB2967022.1 type VII secretion-associated serine protease mycosin [Leifsonia aquatica]